MHLFGYDIIEEKLDDRMKNIIDEIVLGLNSKNSTKSSTFTVKTNELNPFLNSPLISLKEIKKTVSYENENIVVHYNQNSSNKIDFNKTTNKLNALANVDFNNKLNKAKLASIFLKIGKSYTNFVFVKFLKSNINVVAIIDKQQKYKFSEVWLIFFSDDDNSSFYLPNIFRILKQKFNSEYTIFGVYEHFCLYRDYFFNNMDLFNLKNIGSKNFKRNIIIKYSSNTELSKNEIPLENIISISYDEKNKTVSSGLYSMKLYLHNLSSIKNIDCLKYIDTDKVEGEFFLNYKNLTNKKIYLQKKKIDEKTIFEISDEYESDSLNTIIPNVYERDKNSGKNNCYYRLNENEYKIVDKIDVFIEKSKEYFKSNKDLAVFFLLYNKIF